MNVLKYYIHTAVLNLLLLLVNGAIFQTFLLECGISEHMVNIYASVMQVVQLATMLIFSKKMDRVKNIICATAYWSAPVLIMLVFLLVMSINHHIPMQGMIVMLFALGGAYNLTYAVYSIFSYKLPYHIIPMKNYGTVQSLSGALTGVVCLAFSAALSFFQRQCTYFFVMKITFLIGIFLVPVMFFVTRAMKKTQIVTRETEKQAEKKINMLKYRPFYLLLFPNFFRGFCAGIITVAVTIGYHQRVLDVRSASVLVVIMNAIMLVSCLVYPMFSKKIGEAKMLLFSGIGVFVSLPLMLSNGTSAVFLICYGFVYFFFTIINYAVPVAVTQIVDYSVIGQYSALRLLLHAAGSAIAGFVCTPMLDFFGGLGTLLISGTLQLISGVAYFLYMRKNKNLMA